MDTEPPTSVGRSLTAYESADLDELRDLISPKQSLALLDDFAKWLFAIAAVVGSLGTAFGVSSASDLTGTSKTRFAWAVACTAVSLTLAAFARLPLPVDVNRNSSDSLETAIASLTRARFWLLAGAAVAFGAALLLAAASVLAS